MKDRRPFPFRNFALWLLLACLTVLSAYLIFIGCISLWVGFDHTHQDGSWLPLLAGGLIVAATGWVFFRFSKLILNQTRRSKRLGP
ncbi:MAG: hypothetical protein DRH11_07815 [Deltaproteobacteria bacterium]|nr:MAG: hypothetical protein DRH11_07815 [Deltaproteobacteria bacterium]